MPERRREGQRAESFRLELEKRSEFLDAVESDAMRVERRRKVEKRRGQTGPIPSGVADAQPFETKRWEKENCSEQHDDSDGGLRGKRRTGIFHKCGRTGRGE